MVGPVLSSPRSIVTLRLLWLRGLFLGAVVTALVMAFLPRPPSLALALSDKGQHALAFLVLAVLARAAFPKVGALRLFVGLAGLGGLIELLQGIEAIGRDASLGDWLVDCLAIGVVLGVQALVPEKLGRRCC
jgi:hypothetical protein